MKKEEGVKVGKSELRKTDNQTDNALYLTHSFTNQESNDQSQFQSS